MPHNQLSEKASEIATNRPRFWELALFAQVITDEIERQKGLASTLPSSTMIGVNSAIFKIDSEASRNDCVAWVQSKLTELADLINQFSKLLAAANQNAFGLPGQPGDPEEIAQLGIQVGKLYVNALVFANVVRVHHFDCSHYYPECRRAALIAAFAKIRDQLITEASAVAQFYEGYGPEILRRIQDAVSKAQLGESINLDLTIGFNFKFDIANEVNAFVSFEKKADRIYSNSPDRIIKMAEALASIASESLRIADNSTEIRTRKSELNKARNGFAKCKNLVAKYSYLSISNLQSIEDMIVAIESETCSIQHTKTEIDQELIQGAAAFRDRCDSRRNLRQIYIRRLLK